MIHVYMHVFAPTYISVLTLRVPYKVYVWLECVCVGGGVCGGGGC